MDNAQGAGEPTGIIRDHLANERTLLAWTRTSLAAAALGFVVARIRVAVGATVELVAPQHVFSSAAGVAIVVVALAMQVIGVWRYLDLRARLRGQPFRPLGWAMISLNIAIAAAILLLLVYLLAT